MTDAQDAQIATDRRTKDQVRRESCIDIVGFVSSLHTSYLRSKRSLLVLCTCSFFIHTAAAIPGVRGLIRACRDLYPIFTASCVGNCQRCLSIRHHGVSHCPTYPTPSRWSASCSMRTMVVILWATQIRPLHAGSPEDRIARGR